MIKIDLHTHSKPVSRCGRLTNENLIDLKIKQGYGGMVLSNHCQRVLYANVLGQPLEPFSVFAEAIIASFREANEYGKKKGFTVYLGLEVTISNPHNGDWMLYGLTEEILRKAPPLDELSQQELYEFCKQEDVLLVEAHPFRKQCFIGDPNYMDGVEINCTPCDYALKELSINFAKEHNLLLTCGTDCHYEDDRFRGGVLIPEGITTAVELANYLKTMQPECLIYK